MAKRLHTVLFDLDGTLLDSAAAITASLKHTFAQMNKPFAESDAVRFIGPPLLMMMKAEVDDEAMALRMVDIYRAHHKQTGMAMIKPFEGVRELLEDLKAKRLRLIVATSRMRDMSVKLLETHGLLDYFDEVFGAGPDGTNAEKIQIMQNAALELALDVEGCIMVGDRRFDVEGANALHMRSVVVNYDENALGEFAQAKPTYFSPNMQTLKELLLSL